MTWESAIQKFHIPKIYQQASLEKVAEHYAPIADLGREWLTKLNPLYVSGATGSGKTYFFYAILKELIKTQKYQWIIVISSDVLDDELLEAAKKGNEEDKIKKYTEVPILFIDDLGVERPENERVIKQYYRIIDHRMNNLMTTVFTSNIAIEQIKNKLGDRIASRLEMAQEIKFPKKDLRKN